MVTKSDSAIPSGSGTPSGWGTSTSVSQNRLLAMPESFAALDNEEWDLCGYQRVEQWTKSAVSCCKCAWNCLAPTSKSGNGHVGKLCHAEGGITEKICTKIRGSNYTRPNFMPGIASGMRNCQTSPICWEYLSAEPIQRQCLICRIVLLMPNLLMCWRIEKYG